MDGVVDAVSAESSPVSAKEPAGDLEPIARAMAEWSSERRWEERHANNRRHWMFVAEAVMSDDPAIVEPVMARVIGRKATVQGGEPQ